MGLLARTADAQIGQPRCWIPAIFGFHLARGFPRAVAPMRQLINRSHATSRTARAARDVQFFVCQSSFVIHGAHHGMNRCLRSLSCLLAATALALFAPEATARTNPKQQPAKKTHDAKKPHDAKKTLDAKKDAGPQRNAAVEKRRHAKLAKNAKHADAKKKSKRAKDAPAPKETKEAAPALTGDLALVKEAINLARKAKTDEATGRATGSPIRPPRSSSNGPSCATPRPTANFGRYAAFIAANPEWPSAAQLRRRAEARLWQEGAAPRRSAASSATAPISARGKLALARASSVKAIATAPGGRRATPGGRTNCRSDLEPACSRAVPRPAHPRRPPRAHGQAHRRQGYRRREARRKTPRRRRPGDRKGLRRRSGKSTRPRMRSTTSRSRRARILATCCAGSSGCSTRRIDDAARLMLAAPPETMALQDTDQWWRERRALARKLLDEGKFQTAYQVVRAAAPPANAYYRPTTTSWPAGSRCATSTNPAAR